MKRFFLILVAVLLICPLVVRAESFVEALNAEYNNTVSFAEIGDHLVIIGDYDLMANVADGANDDIIAQYKEELVKYSSIILLLQKDGMIYLGAEMQLVDGVFTEGTGSALMSILYFQENVGFGN